MNRLCILTILTAISAVCFAAKDRTDLVASNIPDSLKRNAYAVLVYSNTTFEFKNQTTATEKKSYAITILDKKGDDQADFNCAADKFRDLKSFSCEIFNAQGKLLRKYKSSDVMCSGYSTELASDAKKFYLDIDLPCYPVTVSYEYEIGWKNGILAFPLFYPQDDYNLAVMNASYKLIVPENVEFQFKAINMSREAATSSLKGYTSHEWQVKNLPAIEHELFAPSLSRFVPQLYSNPKQFIYDGVPGEITSWETMGIWQSNLNNGRNMLSDETKAIILAITKDAKSDKEKVRILYDYLGKTTRYVSIQLGIGGFQPMPAAEVCKTGFGDCKALTNYLKAMLEVVGIPSHYTIIRSDEIRKSLFHDYANFFQTNHIILQVPLPNDTLWLECTNPRIPFGFIHNSIAGHDALINTEKGGKLCKLPDYPDSLNVERNLVNVDLEEDGSANVNMRKECRAKIYDNYDWFPLATKNEQTDELRENIKLPSVIFGTLQFKEDKCALPALNIDYNWSTTLYGSKTGNRLFIPVNPYRSAYEGLKKNKRVHDICIYSGFKDIDSIFINIPEGFEIESLPSLPESKTVFGSFKSHIKVQDKGILIWHTLYIPSGEYKATEYAELQAFFEKINAAYKSRIILRKRTA